MDKVLDKTDEVCYDSNMKSKKGKKFNSREVIPSDAPKPVANQWQASTRQLEWLEYYMNPRHKDTYANPYQAAIKAGYSEAYAKNIMSKSTALQWVKAANSIMRTMNTEHLRSSLEDIATSRSAKDSDRITAIKLLGMDQGMFVQKQITAHVGLEQALEDLE